MDRYDANTALLWMLACVALLTLGWLIVICVRYYKRNKPHRMATMRGLPKPSKDATRYMKPGSL
jgi:cytochrome c-type biogenesis protein CcmH/NrfF